MKTLSREGPIGLTSLRRLRGGRILLWMGAEGLVLSSEGRWLPLNRMLDFLEVPGSAGVFDTKFIGTEAYFNEVARGLDYVLQPMAAA